jgi:hypothetical protein
MSQNGVGIDLETSLGYLLKEASSALRQAMEAVLRPLGMTVTHYSCLELLAQRPGLSNSELARGAFVTRQSMNVLLQSWEGSSYATHATWSTKPREGKCSGSICRGQDAGRHDSGGAVGRLHQPAEHDRFAEER